MTKSEVTRSVIKTISYLLIIVLLIINLYPFIWMVMNSFKTNREIFQRPMNLPNDFDLSVYAKAWKRGNIFGAAQNSFFVTFITVFLTLIFSSMAAFVTSHFSFKGRDLILGLIIGAQVVSGQIVLIPLFKLLQGMHLYGSLWGLISVTTAFLLPMSIYLFYGLFRDVPRDIYESAVIDGCGKLLYYLKILLPISKPIIASVIIINSLNAWNEYLFALTFTRKASLRTLPLQLQIFSSTYTTNYDMMFAALTMVVVPLLILYIFLQKYFIKGLTAGALKG